MTDSSALACYSRRERASACYYVHVDNLAGGGRGAGGLSADHVCTRDRLVEVVTNFV